MVTVIVFLLTIRYFFIILKEDQIKKKN